MSNLVACSSCKAEIAKSATKCPRCGAYTPAWHASVIGVIGLFVGFLFAKIASVLAYEHGEPTAVSQAFAVLAVASMAGGVGYWIYRRMM